MPINQTKTDSFIASVRKVKGDAVADTVLKLIEETVPDIEKLESGIKTTQNHYGKYLPVIKDKLTVLIFICAGANPEGVKAAARINGVQGVL